MTSAGTNGARSKTAVPDSHQNDQIESFTRKYQVHTLVWYEVHDTMASAITREKNIKAWQRQWRSS
jgi:predicted GIY-YIG superfamily endonuclease